VKLHYYGVQGRVATWFRSYLKTKSEIKSFEKFSSKWGTVRYEVPQGSILGFALHTIYIYIKINK
jgi:hypothetical protein